MCYAPFCKRCGLEYNEHEPHSVNDCLVQIEHRKEFIADAYQRELLELAEARARIWAAARVTTLKLSR